MAEENNKFAANNEKLQGKVDRLKDEIDKMAAENAKFAENNTNLFSLWHLILIYIWTSFNFSMLSSIENLSATLLVSKLNDDTLFWLDFKYVFATLSDSDILYSVGCTK